MSLLSAEEQQELLALAEPTEEERIEELKGLFDDERVCPCGIRAGPYNIVLVGKSA